MPIRHYLPILALFTLFGCFQEPEYAVEPDVEFVSIRARTINSVEDSVEITISFKDGDGDLGLNKGEGEADANNPDFEEFEVDENGEPILDENGERTLNRFRNNFFLEVYRQVDGAYQLVEYPESQRFDGFFPRLSDSDKEKAIEGEISYTFIMLYDFTGSPLSRGDLVRFEVQIVDRNKNLSNVVETTPIIVGEN